MLVIEALTFSVIMTVVYAYYADIDVDAFQTTKTYKSLRYVGVSLFCENGMISKGAVYANLSFILFVGGTLYLLLHNIDWKQYPTFASITAGGGGLIQLGNKALSVFGGRGASKEGEG